MCVCVGVLFVVKTQLRMSVCTHLFLAKARPRGKKGKKEKEESARTVCGFEKNNWERKKEGKQKKKKKMGVNRRSEKL